MLTLKLRDWKPDAVVAVKLLPLEGVEAVERMLLHWFRCLPEFHAMLTPEAITLEVDVQVRVHTEVPWIDPALTEQPEAEPVTPEG